jgi:hypothetical protein
MHGCLICRCEQETTVSYRNVVYDCVLQALHGAIAAELRLLGAHEPQAQSQTHPQLQHQGSAFPPDVEGVGWTPGQQTFLPPMGQAPPQAQRPHTQVRAAVGNLAHLVVITTSRSLQDSLEPVDVIARLKELREHIASGAASDSAAALRAGSAPATLIRGRLPPLAHSQSSGAMMQQQQLEQADPLQVSAVVPPSPSAVRRQLKAARFLDAALAALQAGDEPDSRADDAAAEAVLAGGGTQGAIAAYLARHPMPSPSAYSSLASAPQTLHPQVASPQATGAGGRRRSLGSGSLRPPTPPPADLMSPSQQQQQQQQQLSPFGQLNQQQRRRLSIGGVAALPPVTEEAVVKVTKAQVRLPRPWLADVDYI